MLLITKFYSLEKHLYYLVLIHIEQEMYWIDEFCTQQEMHQTIWGLILNCTISNRERGCFFSIAYHNYLKQEHKTLPNFGKSR